MVLFDWLFGTSETSRRTQEAFDHRKIFEELKSGPGVDAASRVAAGWSSTVSALFNDADTSLQQVLNKFDVVMRGAAGEQAKDAVVPLAKATRHSLEVAAQVGKVIAEQAQGSMDFKNGFPPPHEVPPDNIGWADYVNPVSYAAKSGVRAAHEVVHAEVEERARQQYESYARASNERVASVPRFEPPPKFDADVVAAPTAPVPRVRPEAGRPPAAGDGNSPREPLVPLPRGAVPGAADSPGANPAPENPAPGNPVPGGPVPDVPAESEAAWAAPGLDSVPPPVPGSGAASGGVVGGVVVPPGSGEPSVGGATGAGGRPGPGTGAGRGGGGAGPGGRSGVGGPRSGAAGTSAAGARGGDPVGGVAGGGAPAGRRSDGDQQRGGKYLVETGEAWADLGLPQVAPPVFGDWSAAEDKPPRPPEDD